MLNTVNGDAAVWQRLKASGLAGVSCGTVINHFLLPPHDSLALKLIDAASTLQEWR